MASDYDTSTMPPAILEDPEERKRRENALLTMPPAPLGQPDSNGWRHPMHLSEAASAARPTMPPPVVAPKPEAPDLNKMPPAFAPPSSTGAAPARPEVDSSTQTMPPAGMPSRERSSAFHGNQAPDFWADATRTASEDKPADENLTRMGNAAVDRLSSAPVDIANPLGKGNDASAAMRASGGTDPSKMPPAFFSGASEQPRRPESNLNTMPPATLPASSGPATKRFEDFSATERPAPHGFWKRALEVASQAHPLGRIIEGNIPGTPGNWDQNFNRLAVQAAREQGIGREQQTMEGAAAQARFNTPEKRRQYMAQNPDLFDNVSDFEKHDWVLSGKFPQKEPPPAKPERPESLDREAYDDYVKRGMSPAEARKRVLQDAQDVKPDRPTHTSPFEAFAYGTPQEKKAAQDFLAFEKRMGAQYERPTDAEVRYKLFQRDPEGYKAVFGDKAAAGDRTHATEMLKFFQKQRDAISKDFMLGDDEKAQQLAEIDKLEQPFQEAAGISPRGGAASSGEKTVNTVDILDYARKNGVSSIEARKHFLAEGYRIVPATDRVNVIGPDGTPGTVPRSQLEKAKKKGYRVAQ